MATKAKQSDQADLKDAKDVRQAVEKHKARFEAYDQPRRIKALSASRLAQIDARRNAAVRAVGRQGAQRGITVAGSGSEESQRATLFGLIEDVRDDVKIGFEDSEPGTAESFGMGMKLVATNTASLLSVAGTQIESFQNPVLRKKAIDCGVTVARMAEVQEAHDALAGAATAYGSQVGTRKSGTSDKVALMRQVRRDTAYLRKLARRIFRREPSTLREFESLLPRRTPKARVAPDEGAPESLEEKAPPKSKVVAPAAKVADVTPPVAENETAAPEAEEVAPPAPKAREVKARKSARRGKREKAAPVVEAAPKKKGRARSGRRAAR